jgi:hypothetical protein
MEEMGLMRTRCVWLALLLGAGAVLVPAAARGQEVPPADPVFPLPLYHDRPERGGFYAAGEFLYFRETNPLHHQLIAIRGLTDVDGSVVADLNGIIIQGTGGPPLIIPNPTPGLENFFGLFGVPFAAPTSGTFLGSGAPALWADDAGGPGSYQPGFRLTGGWRFHDGSAIEVSWMSLVEARYSAVATLIPQGLNIGPLHTESFLFSPVFNFPNDFAGPAEKIALGNPYAVYGIWNGASVMSIDFLQRFSQYDIQGRCPIFETDHCRCYGLIGVRHVDMWERFLWRTVSEDFQGQAGQNDVALYTNIVSNQMYGPTVGIGDEYYIGHGFSVSLDLRAAGMIDFVHEIAKYERADFTTGSKRGKRDYTVVPELQANLNVWWYPIEGVEIRAGYELASFFNTMAAPDPISFNYGGLDPQWQRQYRFMDGFNAGISFIF